MQMLNVSIDKEFKPEIIGLSTMFSVQIPFTNKMLSWFDEEFKNKVEKLNKTTSVIETHFCTSKKIDSRQVVFPIGNHISKGIFFIIILMVVFGLVKLTQG